MKIRTGGVGDLDEPAVLIDGREVQLRDCLLAAFEVVANTEKVNRPEQRDETEERPDDRQDDEDAATQRLMRCDWRRGSTRRGWPPQH